jgi:pimeloyl-ACP methyl ester carboxylesterase
VDLQHRLVTETLGIKHLHAILGISMGGMNAWQWAEAYPEMMDGVMPVVSLPIPVSGRNLLWRRMVIDAIRSDPDWKDGDYIKAPPGWIVGYTILRMMIDSVSALQHEVPNGQAADILGDAGLADLDTELEKLSMDYRRSPQRVGDAHLADQPANFQRHSWSAAAVSRFPAAIRSETGTVPTDDGVRLHNRQRLDGIWHQTIQPNKDQAIHGTEGHSLRHRPAMDVKLMTKDQDLRFQRDP